MPHALTRSCTAAQEWLARLRAETDAQIEASLSDERSRHFIYEETHSAAVPRLTRLVSPDAIPLYWEFMTTVAARIASDLIGPNVKFHHSKLVSAWSACECLEWWN